MPRPSQPVSLTTSQFDHEVIYPQREHPHNRKLMVVLHGRGDSLRPFRQLNEELGLSNIHYLLLNAPRRYLDGYTWYAFPPKQRLGVLKARKKLFALMCELEQQGWRSEDIYFFGFSQGCLVSCDFAMNYPKRLGGVVGVSGYIYFFKGWVRRLPAAAFATPWLVTHGTGDDALALTESKRDIRTIQAAGLRVAWVEFDKGHEIEPSQEIPLIRRWLLARFAGQRFSRSEANPRVARARGKKLK